MTLKKIYNKWACLALTGASMLGATIATANAQQVFRNTITGDELNIMEVAPKEGRDTPAVKSFLETGTNPYVGVKGCLPRGEEAYLVACSGCHGHLGEGKVGPGLNDNYWTYPKNTTDKGLFETIFGGAQGMMGPHGSDLQLDETLALMAWIRNLNTGEAKDADWLTDAQKASFKPFNAQEWDGVGKAEAAKEQCTIPAN